MSLVRLIRTRWFHLAFWPCFLGLVWLAFTQRHHDEILVARLAREPRAPDAATVLALNERLKATPVRRSNVWVFETLAALLERAGSAEAATEVLHRAVKAVPENDRIRLRYALALHHAGRYTDAEREFDRLLKEGRTHG